MKKLYKNTRTSLLLVTFLLMGQAFAKGAPVAIVDSVQGNVFAITPEGTTKLKNGDHLSDFVEIRTEVGAQITFSDYFDHRYHLSGSGDVKILNQIVELRQGYLWLQSYHENDQSFMIQTANSAITYTSGEAIISFDNYTGQSQLLVLKGTIEFANILDKDLKYNVEEGRFSYIHKDYEHGTPRHPTPIGFKSYEKVTSLFDNVSPMDKENRYEQKLASKTKSKMTGGRVPASVTQAVSTQPMTKQEREVSQQGEIIYIRKKELPKLKTETVLTHHQEKMKKMLRPKPRKKFAPDYSTKSGVAIKIFGKGSAYATPTIARRPASYTAPKKVVTRIKPVMRTIRAREPASVEPFKKYKAAPTVADDFESSLINEYKKQMRHSTEVNSLIKDLKNYDQDYKESY